ncbi:MAG TPA: hypothetical protein DHU33_02125 [Firmicutes bacterium]|nr:hypothetical protein [Bacillota bacterium]
MIIYLCLLLYILVLSMLFTKYKEDNKKKKLFLFMSFLPIILISCMRANTVGVDTYQFTNAFLRIRYLQPYQFETLRYEYGFTYFCWILGKVFSNYQALLIVTSIFINFSILCFIYKNSKNVYLSTILYIICNFYFSYMNIMRQAMAIAIILFAFEELKKNKKILFVIWVIVASFFHSSAILAILFIPFYGKKVSKKAVTLILFLAILAFVFGKNFFSFISSFSQRLSDYSGSVFTSENYFGSLLDSAVYLISLVFGVTLIKNKKIIAENNNIGFLVYMMGLAVIMNVLVMRVSIFNRFAHYFTIFIIIWLPNVVSSLENKKTQFLLKTIIVVFFIIYWLVIMIYRPNWYGVVPYRLAF